MDKEHGTRKKLLSYDALLLQFLVVRHWQASRQPSRRCPKVECRQQAWNKKRLGQAQLGVLLARLQASLGSLALHLHPPLSHPLSAAAFAQGAVFYGSSFAAPSLSWEAPVLCSVSLGSLAGPEGSQPPLSSGVNVFRHQ